MNRNGEQGGIPARNSRVFTDNGYWYYTTREGINIGPFDSQHEAEKGVSSFIDFILHADPQVVEVLRCYRSAA